MDDANALPDMPESGAGGRGQLLESVASMTWSLAFLAYSSSTVLSEFGRGRAAAWTLALVAAPPLFATLHPLLAGEPRAARATTAYLLYVLLPPLVAALPVARNTADALAFLALWLPLELRLLPQIGPTRRVSIWASLTAALASVNMFTVLRPFESGRPVGYTFKLGPFDLFVALLVGLVATAVIAPAAAGIGYGYPKTPRGLQVKPQAAIFLGIYFVVIGEEIMFRGVAQNILERALTANSVLALVVAAAFGGVAHLKSKAQGFSQPNWRAGVLAGLSGVAHGLVWRWTEKVSASALSHALVDYALRTCLRKPAL